MNADQDKRTAIVLLHGIGEQRPMETLRDFVKGVFFKAGRSKPDHLSTLFEVRRLTLKNPEFLKDFKGDVDCFELYWAHHMQGSRLLHITKWLKRLFSTEKSELRK